MVHRPDEFQALNDLVWAITSPSLLNNDSPNTESFNSLDNQDLSNSANWRFNPAELVSFLSDRASHRVGYYFENLVAFWLEKICKVELVASGLQIKDGNRTIGELDFVFRDEQQRLNHWEAAVKFYLHYPDDPRFDSDFIGPNAADNFEKKTNRMFSHQLALSDEVFPDIEIRHAFVKGIIFYHPLIEMPLELPDRLATYHQRGKWFRQSELDLIGRMKSSSESENRRFHIMNKPFWLTAESTEDNQLLELSELEYALRSHFAAKAHPMMVSCLIKDSDSLRETERMFIVSDIWPLSQ